MFQKARESAYLESTSLLSLIVRWRKPLIIIFIVTFFAAIVFSSKYFITPRFRSSVVFFPSSTNSISKALLEESASEKQDILAFGDEEQAEQMLQILNSDEIRETIISRYDLLNHYQIDINDRYPMTQLNEQFKDNISFSRTEFMSVRIDVLDTDPEKAANIANDIAALLDSMKSKIQKGRAQDALAIVKSTYENKLSVIRLKEDSLRKLRLLGVMDYEIQSEILSKEYTLASSVYENEKANLAQLENVKPASDTGITGSRGRMTGATARMKNIEQKLRVLADYGGASVSLNEELSLDREELSHIKRQYDKLLVDASQNMTPKFIVNKAVKAEKKCYPVRWLIVLVSVTLTFILSIIVLLVMERIREIKYNL